MDELPSLIYDVRKGATNKKEFMKRALLISKLSKNELSKFYDDQMTSQVFKPPKNNFEKITSPFPFYSLQMDLVDISNQATWNNHFNFMLTIVDVASRYGWAILLKNKSGPTVLNAFESWVKENQLPFALTLDNGSEFINKQFTKFCEDNDIVIYFARPGTKNQTAIVERFNRTLRGRIEKYKVMYDTKVWYHELPSFLENYNSHFHSGVGGIPAELIKRESVLDEPRAPFDPRIKSNESFKVGDSIRYLKKKNIFDKEGKKWSRKVHKITKIEGNRIWLAGKDDEQSYFLPRELQKVDSVKTAEDYGFERKVAPNDLQAKQEKPKNIVLATTEAIEKREKEAIAVTREKRIPRNKDTKKSNRLFREIPGYKA